jgi:hypothetical protein
MDPFLWNYFLEKGLEEDSFVDKDDSVQSLEHKSPSCHHPCQYQWQLHSGEGLLPS